MPCGLAGWLAACALSCLLSAGRIPAWGRQQGGPSSAPTSNGCRPCVQKAHNRAYQATSKVFRPNKVIWGDTNSRDARVFCTVGYGRTSTPPDSRFWIARPWRGDLQELCPSVSVRNSLPPPSPPSHSHLQDTLGSKGGFCLAAWGFFCQPNQKPFLAAKALQVENSLLCAGDTNTPF